MHVSIVVPFLLTSKIPYVWYLRGMIKNLHQELHS